MESMGAIWSITKCSHTFPCWKRANKASSSFFMSSYGDLREKKESWKFLIWDPRQHSFVIFNLKLGWLPMSFLKQATYFLEAYEVMNPRLQTDYNSKLKWESYNWLNQGCIESMIAQWCWFQLKIGTLSCEVLWENHIWFWSLGSQESSASNGFQFRVETNEI